jgi:outer membrane receptor for Fe3+-dicitrate
MPFPSELNVSFTDTEMADIKAAFTTIKTIITGKAVINLTPDERREGPSVNNVRLPYVDKAINYLAPEYPSLVPGFYNLAQVQNNMDCVLQMRELSTLAAESQEIITDFGIANERLAYQFTLDFYENCKRGEQRNVPGAGTSANELKPLFDKENNPENTEDSESPEDPENPENP